MVRFMVATVLMVLEGMPMMRAVLAMIRADVSMMRAAAVSRNGR